MADTILDRAPIDQKTGEWAMLKRWLRARIEELRDELEHPGADVQLTRGRIAELREFIRKVEPDLPEEGSSGVYFPQRSESPTS